MRSLSKKTKGNKTMTTKKQAVEELKRIVSKGDTIYFIVKNVSNSGMFRHIDFYHFGIKDEFEEGQDRIIRHCLTMLMCDALGYRFKNKTRCMGVSGGGMDMGFHVIHQLGHELFDDGYALKHQIL